MSTGSARPTVCANGTGSKTSSELHGGVAQWTDGRDDLSVRAGDIETRSAVATHHTALRGKHRPFVCCHQNHVDE